MKIERLIEMANDIGQFFKSEPDREEAINGIAGHIQKFWEPRMRRQILAALEQHREGLDPLVQSAVERLQA